MSAVTTKARTQRERTEESAQRLLAAAVELIAEQGFRRTTTAEISRRAGFSNAMVHVRYGSKERLLAELLRMWEERLLVNASPGTTGMVHVLGQVESIQRMARDYPALLQAFCMLAFESLGPDDEVGDWLRDWRHRYVVHTSRVLRSGQADGSVRAEVDTDSEAQVFQDFGTGLCFRWALDPDGVDLIAELDRWRQRLQVWLSPAAF
jgi:AcrR family transcriptional regulator